MARPTKKAISKAQEASKALDRIFAEVDPNLLIAGTLGGLAAYGGIVPPFTRLLMTMTQANGFGTEIIKEDIDKVKLATVIASGPVGILGGAAGTLFGILIKQELENGGVSSEVAEKIAADISTTALFASGALEAMLMFKAFSSPGLLEAVVKAPAEMIKGVGEIVPG